MKQETKFKDTEIGMIPEDWTVKELNELCTLITDGKHGDCKNEIYSAYYFLSCKDVNGGILHYSKARQITKQDFLEADKRTNLQIGNILLTNSGTIGRLAIAKDPEKTRRTTFQKSVAIVKNKQELIQSKFLYYYFMSKEREIKELSVVTTQ
jgi:type I restriction enzyme S subunit